MKQVKILKCTSCETLETEVNATIKEIEEEYTPGKQFLGGRIRDIKYTAFSDTIDNGDSYSAMIIFEV